MLVYILRLADGCFYVGSVKTAADFAVRLAQHAAGEGAEWTKLHPVEGVYRLVADALPAYEDAHVVDTAAEHGVDRVRGGTFCAPVLSEACAHVLAKMVDSCTGACYLCHNRGHCSIECPVTLAMAASHGGDWTCPNPKCKDHQFGCNAFCRRCGAARPETYEPVTLRGKWKVGDWTCPGPKSGPPCGDHQFARNAKCRICGTAKPIATPAPVSRKRPRSPPAPAGPERAPAAATEDDAIRRGEWRCQACGANNYAYRAVCFKCAGLRPTADTADTAEAPDRVV